MRQLLGVGAAAILVLNLVVGVGRAAPHVDVVPRDPRVGEVMFLKMWPEGEVLRAACSWSGKSYRLLENDETYDAVLPVSLTAKPGATRAVLYWKYTDGRMGQIALPVNVQPREFGVQHLKLSESQERKYSAKDTEREKKLIGAALDLVTFERRWQESFVMPVEGRVSTEFGLERYVNGRFSYRHRGVDIACPSGTPVKAAADGIVALAEEGFILHGTTVILDHGQGVSTLYIHLSEISVTAGERVRRGETIGRVGSTGVATGPHLHFAVYAHHEAVDPFFWTDLPGS